MNLKSIYIVGCGDTGNRVASLAAEQGISVYALSRQKKFANQADSEMVKHLFCDLDTPESLAQLDMNGSPLLYLAPPPGGGIADTRVTNLVTLLGSSKTPSKVVYISTTAVYGNTTAEIVTEETPLAPQDHTARRRCHAEESFKTWCASIGIPLVILRVAGIYGPGRIPMQRIDSGEPLLDEKESGYTNRIHTDDLAQVCMAALERGEDGDIFNVCDGEVSKMNDYFNAITDILGRPRLPQVSLAEARQLMTPLMFGYMTSSRKISNKKMLEKLGIKLKYPTLKDGLKISIEEQIEIVKKGVQHHD